MFAEWGLTYTNRIFNVGLLIHLSEEKFKLLWYNRNIILKA